MHDLILGLWLGVASSVALSLAYLLWLRSSYSDKLVKQTQDAFERGRVHGLQSAVASAQMAAAIQQQQCPQGPFYGGR